MPSARDPQAPIRANLRDSCHSFSLSASPRLRGKLNALTALVFLTPALLASANNPYTGIVDRNVFSLKPKQEEVVTPVAPPTPPVKLTLTGITTILGNKRALLKGQLPPRPPEQAKDESYMLSEGQRQDGIEIVSIDEKAGKVVVNNNGIPETLDFVNHGAKLMAAAPPPTTPGVIPPPPGMGGGAPHPAGLAPGASRTLPARNFGTQQNGAAAGGSANQSNPVPPGLQPIDPGMQAIMMEAEREITRDAVSRGDAPPLPPTDLTPEDSPDLPAPPVDGDAPELPF